MEQGDTTVPIAYHVFWPANDDPWFIENPADANARVNSYNLFVVPSYALDGDTFMLSPHNDEPAVRAGLRAHKAISSHLWMDLWGWVDPTGDSVSVRVRVVADSAIGGLLNKLFVAMTNKCDHWDIASPNGETDFYNALYKLYPDANGATFVHSGNTSDTVSYTARFALRRDGNLPIRSENLKFVAWVQNASSKHILQTCGKNFSALISPHSFDTLYADVPTEVTWWPDCFHQRVRLQLNRDYPNGEWETVLDSLPNTGSAVWTVTEPTTETARFRLLECADSMRCDTSKGDIKIRPSATLTVTPNPIMGQVAPGDTTVSSLLVSNTGTSDAQVTVAATTGAVDYVPVHSTDPGGPAVDWIDARAGQTGPVGYDTLMLYHLPFVFPFYGQIYNRIWVSTNGWFSFSDPGTNTHPNALPLPQSNLGAFVAVYWDNLSIVDGSTTRIWPDSAHQRVVVAWIDAWRAGCVNARTNAEAILYDDGRLEFQYGTLTDDLPITATVGIQANDSVALTVYRERVVPSNHAVAFHPRHAWAWPGQTTFTVGAGSSYTLPLIFDARRFTRDTTVDGTWSFSGNVVPAEVAVGLRVRTSSAPEKPEPLSFAVSEAYPNPFNPSTTLEFTLEKTGSVKLTVYTVTGQVVATVLDKKLEAGTYRQTISGEHWATGLYLVRLEAGEHKAVRKLLLIK